MGRTYTRPEFLLLIFLAGAVKLDGAKAFRWLKGKASSLCSEFVSQRLDAWRHFLTLLGIELEAIRACAVEIAAKVRPVVVAVLKEVQEATVELYGFVFACKEQASQEHDEQARNAWCKRVVLIVTVKSGRSYKAIKDALGIDNDSPVFTRACSQTESLPPPPSFMRHFAVFLVPQAIWVDETMNLLQKFEHGSYFELVGPDMTDKEGGGVCWREEKVRSIDGIEEVGLVTYDNEAIIESFYNPLRKAWGRYDTIWWNCSDFTIRLACMILPDPDHKQLLRRLLLFICDSRLWALKYAINKSHGRMFTTGWAGAMISGLGVFGSALLVGAAPVVFPIACVGSCTFGLGSGILGSWRSGRVGAKEYPEWRRRSDKLEQQFPQLRELIGE
ncbi:hypothetical protein ASPNIDRAFT_43261 [Aspergillus niger ATCC 1015]|uniref:Uncharacterized protein n=1 Tax=Aspergillus niger (strain ATCC 1015 / CBS 113.46 / FGSC A1144 / LSHB Ac4 / NCTC 3858a / NRRL 328 / USDA 3528.7) TaxID=380704 RepID=G3XMW7_ASPNA|nr:hypothetical protein ASPNIDRAFT_43261 [Aspergillus niger ATCC 1015]